ncbi:Kynurenine--oxoglutarate transaminase 3, partial [Mucuna pruriens]
MLGLIKPGEEVILFAPYYDSYLATLSMAGAKVRCITLHPPHFSVPIEELKSTVSQETRAIFINTPHNPTGKMFTPEELNAIATLCIRNDVLVFFDEVYDKWAYDIDHVSIASLPGIYDELIGEDILFKRMEDWIGHNPYSLDMGSAIGTCFSHFYFHHSMQWAAAAALRAPDSYFVELKRDYMENRDILVEGLKDVEIQEMTMGMNLTLK